MQVKSLFVLSCCALSLFDVHVLSAVAAESTTVAPSCFIRFVLEDKRSVWIPTEAEDQAPVPLLQQGDEDDTTRTTDCIAATSIFVPELIQDFADGTERISNAGLNITEELGILLGKSGSGGNLMEAAAPAISSSQHHVIPHRHLVDPTISEDSRNEEDGSGTPRQRHEIATEIQLSLTSSLAANKADEKASTRPSTQQRQLELIASALSSSTLFSVESYAVLRSPKLHIFTYADMLNSYLCVLSRLVQQLLPGGGRLNILGGRKMRRHSDAVLSAHERGENAAGLDFNIRGSKLEQASRLFKVLQGSHWRDETEQAVNQKLEPKYPFLAPHDVILLSDGFDVFAQRDLRGLLKTYLDLDPSSSVVYYGGEKNCWPAPHHNITVRDFESRNCLVERRCPFDNGRQPWKLYSFFDVGEKIIMSRNNKTTKTTEESSTTITTTYPEKLGRSILGKDLCFHNLRKYSPPRTESVNRFPYLNAGLSIGSVHSLQKLSRRLFRLYAETKQLDDQALLSSLR
ncbi:unnamed protein product [Amoebophrya sp. A25]|nr:unnamed protein product [Amoebophrya sp. A25]|eukprot:GSA25T00017363001.1